MINKVILIGRLTKDPEQRILPSGSRVVDFSLAYNRRYKVNNDWKEDTHFFDIKAYGALADRLISSISKGYMVYVEGRLVQDRWVSKDGKSQSKVSIFAENVKTLLKPQDKGLGDMNKDQDLTNFDDIKTDIENTINEEEDDDVPF